MRPHRVLVTLLGDGDAGQAAGGLRRRVSDGGDAKLGIVWWRLRDCLAGVLNARGLALVEQDRPAKVK